MPYDSRSYRVLIASPSDVEEEREIAVRVIQEWNDLYSYSRRVVLLPLRWETHTAPEYGTRPQEVINRAIVDQCDLLIGIFWTRIGTPTGIADSGTLEEIKRVAAAGKPVMLYFSKLGMDPDKLDLDQLSRLKKFKEETYPNALTESYKSQVEFRDKFAKQLELKVRDLQKADDSGQPPPLTLTLAAGDSGYDTEVTRSVEMLQVEGFERDTEGETDEVRKRIEAAVKSGIRNSLAVPVRLAISNRGTSGIRNLYVQVSIIPSSGEAEVSDAGSSLRWFLDAGEYFTSASSGRAPFISAPSRSVRQPSESEDLTKTDDGWEFAFEWGALQPQRERVVKPELIVRVGSNSEFAFRVKVFADSFPEPLLLEAKLNVAVQSKRVALADLYPNLDGFRTVAVDSGKKDLLSDLLISRHSR